jgi:hypothetical protein
MQDVALTNLRMRLTTLSAQCLICAAACAACVDAAEASGLLDTFRRLMRAAADCREICEATARVAERYDGKTHVLFNLVRVCARASADTAAACDAHVETIYAACARACRECEQACVQTAAALRWR